MGMKIIWDEGNDESEQLIFLKTAFPSRKYHKRYQEES